MFVLLICQHCLMAYPIFTVCAWVAPPSCAILVHVVWGESKLYPMDSFSRPLMIILSSGMALVRWQGHADFYATEFVC